eukprot:comp12831_c0_seq1/m.7991 comp12831_c0_seq1/g.7991  ORF comp12831_c0_seq1/g.7991 comp12831_c0_seq1/m.7991 type:complete len:462 (-) comp12831_c0_seq1:351-1736(-)
MSSAFIGLSPRRALYLTILAVLTYLSLRKFQGGGYEERRRVDPTYQPAETNDRRETLKTQKFDPEAYLNEEMGKMEKDFRVYVYDLATYQNERGQHPFKLYSQQCGISAGNNKGYGVERYFVDQISNSIFRTTDPLEADLFLIPVLPCPAKWEKSNPSLSKEENHERGKAFSQQYVTNAIDHIATKYPYYNGTRPQYSDASRKLLPPGSDHFWFSTHDGGATRGQGAGSTFLHNSIALVNTADVLMGYRPCWHVSLPCNCDFKRPPPQEEYDVLFSDQNRKPSVFFAGNLGSNELRKTVYNQVQGDPFFHLVSGRMDDADYQQALRTSTFCLHLRGFQVWSPRLIEYIWYGCIPVVLGDDYYLPYSAVFDWDQMSIRICEKDAANIKQILKSVSVDRLASIRKRLREVVPHFTYHQRAIFGDAFYIGMYELYLRHKHNAALLAGDSEFDRQLLCDRRMDQC